MQLIYVERIWDQAPHNAFTDLVRYKNKWFCAFREGSSHVSDDGKLRVISSNDGVDWSSVILLGWDDGDVRDAKLSITAQGKLMLNGAVRFLKPENNIHHQSLTWLSSDGTNWEGAFTCPCGVNTWRWSVTWQGGYGYSFAYSGKDEGGCLYRTMNGESWEILKDNVYPDVASYPNEASLVFTDTNNAICLLRRDRGTSTALLGRAKKPFTTWSWSDLGVQIGGPKIIRLTDGRLISAVRLYDQKVRTSLCCVDSECSRIQEALALPSGGDTSYAGMVEFHGNVWISYYSSHEGKTSIYLAVVKL